MSRTDKGKFIRSGFQFKEYGCDKYTSFKFLFQLVVECYEKFLKSLSFFRKFEKYFGKKCNSKTCLYSVSRCIAYIEKRFVSFFVVSERITDDFIFPENLPEKIESLQREILDIFREPVMHDREKLVVGILI